ncbi:hypothetical protein EDB85DRAFT_1862913 [Lactarius pseudohatsudake]|nr:hypothetical protein EDB85DRAFT_1862913 [Lactarius pseudohatsudake]
MDNASSSRAIKGSSSHSFNGQGFGGWQKVRSSSDRFGEQRNGICAARRFPRVTWEDMVSMASCDLARVLVGSDELARSAPSQDVHVPPSLAFGIREREQRMLFAHLPLLSADMSTRREMNGMQGMRVEDMVAHHERELAAGVAQANAVARFVDLRNANAAGVAFENRRRVIAAFSEPGKPDDTGRTEVQAALLTLQIRNMWTHLSRFKRDVANRRNLRRLVHQRAKLLKYLKRTNRDRYERVLERLGLAPGAVEGELVV